MKKISQKVFIFSILCMAAFGAACSKGGEEGENTTKAEAVYDGETGLITANGLAFEVTDDVDNYTMSVFAIADEEQTEFMVPKEVIYEEQTYQITALGDSAFEGEEKLKKVEIADGVETIGENAFYDCGSLEEVIIPDSVTEIKDYAFGECEKLAELNLPDSITDIGTEVFTHCNSITEFHIPKNVVSMGGSAFFECEKLEKVVLEEGVTDLPAETFTNCTALKTVVLPETLLTIGNEVFWSCDNLTALEIPKNVASIGKRCFYTSGIKELTICSPKIYPENELFEGSDISKIIVPERNLEKFQEFYQDTDVKVEEYK